jgi:hypothetical protein
VRFATRYRCSLNGFVSCTRGDGTPRRRKCATCGAALLVEQGVHGIYVWRGDGRYPARNAVQLFTSATVADQFANDHLADGYVVRWIRSEDVPAALPQSEEPLVGKTHQLAADSWRVIGHLYNPSLTSPYSRRRDPSMATVCKKQDAIRESVIDVVDRGLVHARLDGNEIPLEGVRRLPEKAIRLRITKAGMYHASHDPISLVTCALRHVEMTLFTLLRGLANPVGFGELCELADRHLFDTYLIGTDTEIPIRQMRDMLSFAYARQTALGRAYAANF